MIEFVLKQILSLGSLIHHFRFQAMLKGREAVWIKGVTYVYLLVLSSSSCYDLVAAMSALKACVLAYALQCGHF